MKQTILCVDDEKDILDALERLFRKKFRVLKANSGQEAVEIFQQEEQIAVIITDQRMPEMTGVEVLSESIKYHPEAIRLLLTGYTDIESVISAINSGEIYRYVTKPWDPVDLANAVDKGAEKFLLRSELKEKNVQLEKALNELKSLDSAKNHFMVLINHELKTPLTAIISFLDLLKESSLDEEQSLYANRIDQAVQRLGNIVNDVVEMVSAETGQTPVKNKKFQLNELTDILPEIIQTSLKKKNQTLDISGMEIKVKADPEISKKVFHRVLHNATKFGDSDSVIHIEGKTDDQGIDISVSNQGPMMSQEAIEKIIKPFTLIEEVLHHSTGLGLGLSLSQALLKHHGSTLEFDSKDKVTKVHFVLPPA